MSVFPELRFIPYDYLKEFTTIVRPIRERYYSKRSLVYYLSNALSREEVKFILSGFNKGQSSSDLSEKFLIRYGANSSFITSRISSEIRERTLIQDLIGETFSTRQEFWFLSSRADLAVFDGNSIGIEIKSEKDNLLRLERQLSDYTKFFKFVYVVTYAEKIDELTDYLNSIEMKPGIIIYERGPDQLRFEEKKRPKAGKTDLYAKLSELSIQELISLIHSYEPIIKGLTRMKKHELLSIVNEISMSNLELAIDHKFMERYLV